MRNKTSSSMQKTYDECYLICSTAVYFEGQNNEAEALRSWRSALDQIYYHNAYRVPPNYRPKSETEKALQDSLRNMELQCKERVDLLEALRESRMETKTSDDSSLNGDSMRGRLAAAKAPRTSSETESSGYIGQGTIPAVGYPDLSRLGPPLPQRPSISSRNSSNHELPRTPNLSQSTNASLKLPTSPPSITVPPKQSSRTPSPEKKGRMLTTLRPGRDGKRPSRSPMSSRTRQTKPAASSKAATLAWDSMSKSGGKKLGQSLADVGGSSTTLNSIHRDSVDRGTITKVHSAGSGTLPNEPKSRRTSYARTPSPPDHIDPKDGGQNELTRPTTYPTSSAAWQHEISSGYPAVRPQTVEDLISLDPPTPPTLPPPPPPKHVETAPAIAKSSNKSPPMLLNPEMDYLTYRNEYPATAPISKKNAPAPLLKPSRMMSEVESQSNLPVRQKSPQRRPRPKESAPRKPVANSSTPRNNHHRHGQPSTSSGSGDENTSSGRDVASKTTRKARKQHEDAILVEGPTTPTSSASSSPIRSTADKEWQQRVDHLTKNLPKGVDEAAARQIFNEIVVKGDEVHWDDVAGLEVAKNALKEAVVYPFLRPDLFMGLREPARGMLLFGPPGTGKTMLARAVATESRSTFFSISASSLTSKFLGESEKLVRALFQLAKALAPSIIFVDEIDSLLSSRSGSGEHEATRRIKTEFLIQWSDLARAAAGREQTEKEKKEGDASRVLVLAATNLPWAIDEAARRRFVRRQYIPLPEGYVRGRQLRTLLGHQKHSLSDEDINVLIELADGFSGSDITALAKDAAMGPLRSLGEALLHMSMDQIRPIQFQDFEASLINIRPSVSKQGLKEFEDWAREFGERGG
ncbi:MAG: hypothetical protein M1827_001724 [Pycnora praestabilis]|nr:MAG: hypothetical protein M1827_001724 [Pycnora praestabilis]